VYMKPTFAPGAVDIHGQWRDQLLLSVIS